MERNHYLYLMALAGAKAGLLAWALVAPIPFLVSVPQEEYRSLQAIEMVLVSLLISARCVAAADRCSAQHSGISRSWWGALWGALGGSAASGLGVERLDPVRWTGVVAAAPFLTWGAAGAFIGAAVALVRYGPAWRRAAASIAGGVAGGVAAGGCVSGLGERLPYVSAAAGLMLAGSAIALGCAAALYILRRAQLTLESSQDPRVVAYMADKRRAWELYAGDKVVLGRSDVAAGTRIDIGVPDEAMAPAHACVFGVDGEFCLRPHEKNADISGRPVAPLKLNGHDVDSAITLRRGDVVQVGQTFFRFTVRERERPEGLRVTALAAVAGLLWLGASAWAGTSGPCGLRLGVADRPRLLQCEPRSERPCFRMSLNITDCEDKPVNPQLVYDPHQAAGSVRVSSDGHQLRVLEAQVLPRKSHRYALLLVDVSGSMLEPSAGGGTKFDAMLQALGGFTDGCVDGLDRVAIVPFESRGVAAAIAVGSQAFRDTREALRALVTRIQPPSRGANTALFSAVYGALLSLKAVKAAELRAGRPDPQCLLVVMTDGRNDVDHPGDDPGLLREAGPVTALADEVGIETVTVGFGDSGQLDADSLRQIAWPQQPVHYVYARAGEELYAAFQKARRLQLDRIVLSYEPRQTLRSQLTSRQEFRVVFDSDTGPLETVATWTPPAIPPAPFEGVLDWRVAPGSRPKASGLGSSWLVGYLTTLLVFSALLHLLGSRLPRVLWADAYDGHVLRERALAAVFERRPARLAAVKDTRQPKSSRS